MSERGLKYDGGKVRFGLLPARALGWIARALEYGAAKYRLGNWVHLSSPDDLARVREALRRHVLAATDPCEPELYDPESHLPHMAHAAANVIFLLYHESKQGIIGDPAQLTTEQAVTIERLRWLQNLRDGRVITVTYSHRAGGAHVGRVDLGPLGMAQAAAATPAGLPACVAVALADKLGAPGDLPAARLAFVSATGDGLPPELAPA